MENNKDLDPSKDQSSGNTKSERIVNSLFPTVIVLAIMVGIVIVTNMITGFKIFSLESEKTEVESLRVKYESYEKITMDLEEKQARLKELMNEVPELEGRRNRAEEEYLFYREKIMESDSTLQRKLMTGNEIEARYMAKQEQLGDLTAEIKSNQKKEHELKTSVSQLRSEYDDLNQQVQQLRNDISSKSEELAGFRSRVDQQKQLLKDISSSNAEFDHILADLTEISGDLKEAKNNAEASVSRFSNVLPRYETSVNSLNDIAEGLDRTEKKLKSASNTFATISVDFTETYDNIARAERIITNASNTLSEIDADIDGLSLTIHQSEEAFTAVKNIADSNTNILNERSSQMLSKYTLVDRNMEDILNQLESVKASIQKLEKKMKELQNENK